MSYTAIVVLNNIFLTSFLFVAPHDRSVAYKHACDMWFAEAGDHPAWGDGQARVCAIIPGSHEAYIPLEK